MKENRRFFVLNKLPTNTPSYTQSEIFTYNSKPNPRNLSGLRGFGLQANVF